MAVDASVYPDTINYQSLQVKKKFVYIIKFASDIQRGLTRNNMGYKVCNGQIYGSFAYVYGIASQVRSGKQVRIEKAT